MRAPSTYFGRRARLRGSAPGTGQGKAEIKLSCRMQLTWEKRLSIILRGVPVTNHPSHWVCASSELQYVTVHLSVFCTFEAPFSRPYCLSWYSNHSTSHTRSGYTTLSRSGALEALVSNRSTQLLSSTQPPEWGYFTE